MWPRSPLGDEKWNSSPKPHVFLPRPKTVSQRLFQSAWPLQTTSHASSFGWRKGRGGRWGGVRHCGGRLFQHALNWKDPWRKHQELCQTARTQRPVFAARKSSLLHIVSLCVCVCACTHMHKREGNPCFPRSFISHILHFRILSAVFGTNTSLKTWGNLMISYSNRHPSLIYLLRLPSLPPRMLSQGLSLKFSQGARVSARGANTHRALLLSSPAPFSPPLSLTDNCQERRRKESFIPSHKRIFLCLLELFWT